MSDNKLRAAITAVEAYLPDEVITNDDIAKMVDTSDEWIMTRVGIRERRRLSDPSLGMSYMTTKALQTLLEKNHIDPSEIDGVICSTATPDMIFPSSACITAHNCGIKNAFCYDMSVGCTGFVYAFKTAALYIESGFCKKVIVLSGEKMSSILNYEDRNTCPLFGDGASAVLVEGRTDGTGLYDAILRADGTGAPYLNLKGGGSLHPATHETVDQKMHYVYQDGKFVFKWAVTKMADVSCEIMERNGLKPEDIAYLLPHQANLRIIDAVANRMGINREEKVLVNIEHVGNTSSVTIPILMWENLDKFKKGDNLILSSFGAGFTWGSLYLKWSI